MKIILDRIEKDSDGKRIFVFEIESDTIDIIEDDIPSDIVSSIGVGDIVDAEVVDNKLISAKILTDETEAKRKEMKSRLNGLFSKKKK